MKLKQSSVDNEIIAKSLKKSMFYAQYRALVAELVQNRSTTGNEKTEALINYTMLNDKRMKRWDKMIKISDAAKTIIQNYDKKITWLVITESWCGDAAHVMPVIHKVAELNKKIDYKIVLRDENDELMQLFLTDGNRAIPKLIMIDNESGKVINTFGARPSVATAMVKAFKEEHGILTPEFKEDLQRWYNKDKGQSTINDLIKLLA